MMRECPTLSASYAINNQVLQYLHLHAQLDSSSNPTSEVLDKRTLSFECTLSIPEPRPCRASWDITGKQIALLSEAEIRTPAHRMVKY